jgi:hypothetical protein
MDLRWTCQVLTPERFGACPLADFAFCQPPGQISFICLVNRDTAPPLPFGLQGGVSITVYRLPFPGVVARHLNDFQGRLRAITSVESVYFICICAHQTGYGGQWGD